MTDNDSTTQFISSLVKSLQALCHGYVDFQKNIEIIGHIYINVDSQQKFDYIVNEQVCKNGDESPAMFVSNSFHALPNHKPVRTFVQNDSPLDLKTIVAKDVSGVDLSTFHSDTGQGRSTSRESSQSLSAGSESGSLSGSLRESILSSSRQNPENYVSRRKRHLNNVSCKQSPAASPTPHSRSQEGDRREPQDSPSSRSQYTLGASASKLARRISSELERQSLPTPVYPSDSEVQARLSSPPDHVHPDPRAYHRHFPAGSRPRPDPPAEPQVTEGPLEEGIDLTRVKEEVVDEQQLFDQFDWARGTRDSGQETSFPRTGPDDPQSEGPNMEGEATERGDTSPSSALYPVMLHHNTAVGYGSPVFPQNFSDTPHTVSANSSPVPSTSGQPSPGGGAVGVAGFPVRRQQPGHAGRDAGSSSSTTVKLKCKLCPYSTSSVGALKRHLRTWHIDKSSASSPTPDMFTWSTSSPLNSSPNQTHPMLLPVTMYKGESMSVSESKSKQTEEALEQKPSNLSRNVNPHTPPVKPHTDSVVRDFECFLPDMESSPQKQTTAYEGQVPVMVMSSNMDDSANKVLLLCTYCNKSFRSRLGLKLHVDSKHLGKLQYKCKICGKAFSNLWTYRNHLSSHNLPPNLKTEFTESSFQVPDDITKQNPRCLPYTSASLMADQIEVKDESQTRMYSCHMCGRLFKWRSSLKYHRDKGCLIKRFNQGLQ